MFDGRICPNCGHALQQVEERSGDGGFIYSYECGSCGKAFDYYGEEQAGNRQPNADPKQKPH
jgi:hypothetical protein